MVELHRTAQVTATDHGPLVNVASWILMVTAILFTAFRLVSNIVLRGRFRTHDWVIIVATALAIGQSIATSLMVSNGLGQHQAKLSASTIVRYEQCSLTASVLYVATFASVKLSLYVFLNEMLAASQATFHKFMYAVWISLVCYTIAATFSLVFACGIPNPYDEIGEKCMNLLGFWDFHAVFDILVSFTIFLLPSLIVFPLQMDLGLKAHVVFPFALELPLCAFAVVRLVYIHKAINANDHTWANVDAQIWTQITMHLGVVAANVPSLKIFLKGFQSVLFRTDTARLQSEGVSQYSSKSTSWRHANQRATPADANMFQRPDGETVSRIATSYTPDSAEDAYRKSENAPEGRIYKTTGWTVLQSQRDEIDER